MVNSKVLIVVASLLLGCTTMNVPAPNFERFPSAFEAIQVLTITHDGDQDTFLANLRKERGGAYDVVFLHPLTQAPLLSLRYRNGKSEVKRLYDKLPAQIPGEEILNSIRSLYDAKDFSRADNTWSYQSGQIVYTLRQVENYGDSVTPCVFPRTIEMQTTAANVRALMHVQTRELECK